MIEGCGCAQGQGARARSSESLNRRDRYRATPGTRRASIRRYVFPHICNGYWDLEMHYENSPAAIFLHALSNERASACSLVYTYARFPAVATDSRNFPSYPMVSSARLSAFAGRFTAPSLVNDNNASIARRFSALFIAFGVWESFYERRLYKVARHARIIHIKRVFP